jgi:membrane fusion protein, multidrug efflux system
MAFVKKSPWRLTIRIIVGLAVLAAVAVAVSRITDRTPPARRGSTTPVPVTAAVATRANVPELTNAIGTVQSMDSVAIEPRVSGEIEKIEFTPGTDVEKGQELFLIDPRLYQAALDQAQGQLAKDEALLKEAEVDLARYQTLEKQKSIAGQQAQDQVYVVKQDNGTVQLDRANVETARLNLEFCHITSPISGRAGTLQVDLGNLVGPQGGQTSGTGSSSNAQNSAASTGGTASSSSTALVTIAQLHPIYVNFSVPQTVLHQVIAGQTKGALRASAYSQAGVLLGTGELTVINNQVNTNTGTAALQATFANTDEALWPGEYVSVQLVLGIRRNVVTVPASSVMVGPDGDYVYVIDSHDKVERVGVQQAARRGGVSVISKGISAGQTVVATGQYRLDNGTVVAIRQTTPPRPTAQSAAGEEPAAADPPQ